MHCSRVLGVADILLDDGEHPKSVRDAGRCLQCDARVTERGVLRICEIESSLSKPAALQVGIIAPA